MIYQHKPPRMTSQPKARHEWRQDHTLQIEASDCDVRSTCICMSCETGIVCRQACKGVWEQPQGDGAHLWVSERSWSMAWAESGNSRVASGGSSGSCSTPCRVTRHVRACFRLRACSTFVQLFLHQSRKVKAAATQHSAAAWHCKEVQRQRQPPSSEDFTNLTT